MKYLNVQSVIYVVGTFVLLTSCSQQTKDKDIKADTTVKAKKEISMANVNYTVNDGVVYLSGVCSSQRAKDKAVQTAKKIAGVKNVVDSITIGPVTIDSDTLLKQSVDSVLEKCNLAYALIQNNGIVLKGQIAKGELPDILDGLKKLPLTKIDNQLTVQ